MDSKKFAWVYLIENGHAGQKPSFYGGFETTDARLNDKKVDYGNVTAFNDKYLHEIKTYGVDWNKTQEPRSDLVSLFTDTFNDPERKEYLFGTLVLKNGTKQSWCAEALEVTNVFEMMSNVYNQGEKFRQIFGADE